MKFEPSTDNRNFDTGAVRGVDSDRGQASLLPFGALQVVSICYGSFHAMPVRAIDLLALLYQAGAKKYAARNWEKGIPLDAYVDSAWRHYMKWRRGLNDEPHTVQFAWNALCMLQTHIWIAADVLPKKLITLPGVVCDRRDLINPECVIYPERKTAEHWADLAWGALTNYTTMQPPKGINGTFSLQYATHFAAYALATLEADEMRKEGQAARDAIHAEAAKKVS